MWRDLGRGWRLGRDESGEGGSGGFDGAFEGLDRNMD